MLNSIVLNREMVDEVRREQRSFATGVWLMLFSGQCCFAASLVGTLWPGAAAGTAENLIKIVRPAWWLWAGLAVAVPVVACVHALWNGKGFATRFSAIALAILFVAAQVLTLGAFSAFGATSGLTTSFPRVPSYSK